MSAAPRACRGDNRPRVLVACETSGRVREAFARVGWDAWSCDILDTDQPGQHLVGDVRDFLALSWDLMIAHPPCDYLATCAAWAFRDPDFTKYPGVGYHQKVKPDTLVGLDRRNAREESIAFVRLLMAAPIPLIAIENPVGFISTRIREPEQIIQPYQFGDDASKATCLWLKGLRPLHGTKYIRPRVVCAACEFMTQGAPDEADRMEEKGCPECGADASRVRPRWANQTDSGQNRLSPSAVRWKLRSQTYQGIADAMAQQWGQNFVKKDR